jgi:hypothetical protein
MRTMAVLSSVIEVSIPKGPNGAGASLPWHEDGNAFSFQYVVFCSPLEYQPVDKAQKPDDFECYTRHRGENPSESRTSLACI